MNIHPDGVYQTQEISGISSKSMCEDECTKWGNTHPEECWMLTYNRGSQSCRLITGSVMPYPEETCDWFKYERAWEAWNRNCIGELRKNMRTNIVYKRIFKLKERITTQHFSEQIFGKSKTASN